MPPDGNGMAYFENITSRWQGGANKASSELYQQLEQNNMRRWAHVLLSQDVERLPTNWRQPTRSRCHRACL